MAEKPAYDPTANANMPSTGRNNSRGLNPPQRDFRSNNNSLERVADETQIQPSLTARGRPGGTLEMLIPPP